jgi:hypothetical protein
VSVLDRLCHFEYDSLLGFFTLSCRVIWAGRLEDTVERSSPSHVVKWEARQK